MTLLALADAAEDVPFQRRCFVALLQPARNILSESDQAANHAVRVEWAQKVMTDNLSITRKQLALQILRNATIAAVPLMENVPDGDIEFQVSVVLDDIIRIG